MKFSFAAITDVGLVRQNNEDNFIVLELGEDRRHVPPPASCEGVAPAERGLLLAVADGMGGALAGEVASRIAVEALAGAVKGMGQEEDDARVRERIRAAIGGANAQIHQASLENPLQRGMGTTLTAAIVRGNRIQFFQVGDSRGFIARRGKLNQMTKDHSLIGQLLEDKVITPEDAESLEGGRNIILQALGPDPNVKIDGTESTLEDGDIVVLCTDGLHGSVKHKDLEETVAGATDSAKLCEDLVGKARDRGGPDNITVIAVAVVDGGTPPPMPGLMSRLAEVFRRKKA
jgi:protein phosphatase